MRQRRAQAPNQTKLKNITIEIVPDDSPDTSYLEQEGFEDRRERYQERGFAFVGIYAEAEVWLPSGTRHVVRSPGLWGIGSDSGMDFFEEAAKEELEQLKGDLASLNVNMEEFDFLAEEALNNLQNQI